MRLVTFPKAERTAEVLDHVRFLLDVGDQGLVDGLLVGGTSARRLLLLHISLSFSDPPTRKISAYLGLVRLRKEFFLPLLRLLGLLPIKVALLGHLVHRSLVHTVEVDLDAGRDHVSGVDSSQGNAVHFEGSGHEQHPLRDVPEEDDALAAKAAGQEDEDGAGGERGTELGWPNCLADLDVEVSSLHIALIMTRSCDPLEAMTVEVQQLHTFFGRASSSAGYHFEAFCVWCGI